MKKAGWAGGGGTWGGPPGWRTSHGRGEHKIPGGGHDAAGRVCV